MSIVKNALSKQKQSWDKRVKVRNFQIDAIKDIVMGNARIMQAQLNDTLKDVLDGESKAAQEKIHKRNIQISKLREDFCLLVSEISRRNHELMKKDSYIRTLEAIVDAFHDDEVERIDITK